LCLNALKLRILLDGPPFFSSVMSFLNLDPKFDFISSMKVSSPFFFFLHNFLITDLSFPFLKKEIILKLK